jgi:aminoglycoside phosphotransferase (APT) family kinase protein
MPGPLIARGRAADVFAAGAGRVLRRYRDGEGDDTDAEALVMEHARRHGFPVPAVHAASGRELVLERVDGPTLLADLGRRPWRVRHHGALLADLHRRLHRIPAPDGLPARLSNGDRLLHLDLHPDNVLLAPTGPVVIDWSNAARGDPADDVALTWAIIATSVVPGSLAFRTLARAGRDLLLGAFLAGVDTERAQARLRAVANYRHDTDPHLLPAERRALAVLAEAAPREAA